MQESGRKTDGRAASSTPSASRAACAPRVWRVARGRRDESCGESLAVASSAEALRLAADSCGQERVARRRRWSALLSREAQTSPASARTVRPPETAEAEREGRDRRNSDPCPRARRFLRFQTLVRLAAASLTPRDLRVGAPASGEPRGSVRIGRRGSSRPAPDRRSPAAVRDDRDPPLRGRGMAGRIAAEGDGCQGLNSYITPKILILSEVEG